MWASTASLQTHQIEDWEAQPDSHFEQGAVQLALGACGREFMPEVIGFNLGYEQLPLHLLITAYELNELGIDPYYFTLHVTVDNAASGHARRAIQAAQEAASTASDPAEFWRRVRRGYALNNVGLGTTAAIEGFDLHAELLRVLGSKSAEGKFAHSDRYGVEGRTVNDWLASPEGVEGFVQALERKRVAGARFGAGRQPFLESPAWRAGADVRRVQCIRAAGWCTRLDPRREKRRWRGGPSRGQPCGCPSPCSSVSLAVGLAGHSQLRRCGRFVERSGIRG